MFNLALRNQPLRVMSTNRILQHSTRSYYRFAVHTDFVSRYTTNHDLRNWISQRISIFQPSRVHLCDGSDEEFESLITKQIHQGTLIKLNESLRPNSYLARSQTSDTARVEDRTFICSESKLNVGPTNNWGDPEQYHNKMEKLFNGSMKGRTMYVVPFCMGPIDSEFSMYGVQVTDSPYVVCSMKIMTRMGSEVLDKINKDEIPFWVPCVHSVGSPLNVIGQSEPDEDNSWPCNKTKYIVQFNGERRIWSYGSGYGGNAILGKKCLALRLGSCIAKEEGWLAEHMLIIGVTNPDGIKKYFLGCFPSACGKTNLAMLETSLSCMKDAHKWKVECLGDDIAWIRYNPKDGKLYAINPENGFFGVAPGTSYESNVNAMKTIEKNTIFTNCAVTHDGDVWWEGMTEQIPNNAIAWNKHEWGSESSSNSFSFAAHPNARFCVPITQCPTLDNQWNNANGVPIDGIILGGRRSTTVPLTFQTFNWNHGVFAGSIMASETTAAAAGIRGVLRIDPFAMRPFSGYNMAEYFSHWLSFTNNVLYPNIKLPKIFCVNWFKKERGKILWPGFSENLRVLKWVFQRCDQDVNDMSNCQKTPIGLIPRYDNNTSFDASNLKEKLNVSHDTLNKLFAVEAREWLKDTSMFDEFYAMFDNKVPKELYDELNALKQRLNDDIFKKDKTL